MREALIALTIVVLAIVVMIQGYFIDEYQQTAEESLELAGKWQEAYTELQQDYSQAVELIEQLQYELGSDSE